MVITIYRPWEKQYSSVGWRVRLALEEKNLKYETRLIVLKMKEHLSEEILLLNPRGELPILTDVDANVHEETAMLQYLETYYSSPPLSPNIENRKEHAQHLVNFHEVAGSFSSVCKPLLVALLNSDNQSIDKEQLKKWKAELHQELQRWEKLLGHGEPYILGKTFSLSDVGFFPYLAHLVRYGFPLQENFPKLYKYYTNVLARPTVQKTWPAGWKSNKVALHLK